MPVSTENPELTREDFEKMENVRTEYAAIVAYHSSTVNSRFTVAGLYIAAIGLVASKILFDKDISWLARSGGSLLSFWFTFCVWILELRSRAIYTNIAHRGIDIEHRYWGLKGPQWYEGFFSRQYKEEPKSEADNEEVPKKPDRDPLKLAWTKDKEKGWLERLLSKFDSHSWGFDLLYGGSLVFWFIQLIVSLLNKVGPNIAKVFACVDRMMK